VKIAPSLLAADWAALGEAARRCADAGAECLHFDVMDGRFVPNLALSHQAVKALRPLSKARFEAHLMVADPDPFIPIFVEAGADLVIVQAEVCLHLQRTLARIREAGATPGLALNPATPLDVLDYVLDGLDLLLVMTVNPGFGGQEYIPAMTAKIAQAWQRVTDTGRAIEIEVDGGIGPENARTVTEAGASVLVAGTSVFRHPEGLEAGIRSLREAARG
jgi:ribulose-phosphate 3-epimerase